MNFRRPMLAASLLSPNIEHTDDAIMEAMVKLRYPVLATIKKDGIRALRMNGTLLSRTLKPIPNVSIRERSICLPGGFDMELWNPDLAYHEIESIVMSQEHEQSHRIQFHILDWVYCVNPKFTYEERCGLILAEYNKLDIEFDYPKYCETPVDLFKFFLWSEQQCGEGICFRTPSSPYKMGRSTLKEQYLVKLSRYIRTELKIVGFKEQMENSNPTKYNELGLMKRTSHDSGQVGKNTLGAFVCVESGKEGTIDVGTGVGLTDKMRKHIWDNQDRYLGKVITVKHKPYNQKDKLRHPIFVGFREKGF